MCASATILRNRVAGCWKERARWWQGLCCTCDPVDSGPMSQRWMGRRTMPSLRFAQRVAWWLPWWSARVPDPVRPMSRHHHLSVPTVTVAQLELYDFVKGGRRQSRRRKRWEDNAREWTGLEFTEFQRAVENREKWRKLVADSSVVPRRP